MHIYPNAPFRPQRRRYDPVVFFAMHGTAELWNSGSALEPGSELFTAHICKAAKRAIAARKGRKVGPREYNTQRSAVLRSVHG